MGQGPDIVAKLLSRARAQVSEVGRSIREREIDALVIAARGTSDHAAVYAQYSLGARNGMLVALAAPSLFSLYGTPPRLRHAAVLGISQSGRSPDVVAVLAEARRQGSLALAITNEPDSELAGAADHVIELRAGPEHAVAATKTYLAEMALVAMLSVALSDDVGSAGELERLPDALRAAFGVEEQVRHLAQAWASEDRCAVLARGYNYATAREWALKLKELALVLADPYSGADFQHGPIALVEEGFPVLAIATSGPVLPGMARLLTNLHDAGAQLLVISDDPGANLPGDVIAVPRVAEWLTPLVTVIPAQLFAYHLALARGIDPDAPRHLTKVTRTR